MVRQCGVCHHRVMMPHCLPNGPQINSRSQHEGSNRCQPCAQAGPQHSRCIVFWISLLSTALVQQCCTIAQQLPALYRIAGKTIHSAIAGSGCSKRASAGEHRLAIRPYTHIACSGFGVLHYCCPETGSTASWINAGSKSRRTISTQNAAKRCICASSAIQHAVFAVLLHSATDSTQTTGTVQQPRRQSKP